MEHPTTIAMGGPTAGSGSPEGRLGAAGADPARGTSLRTGPLTLFLLCALWVELVALPPPAQALEGRLLGDSIIGPGETVPEVSTAIGDVRVDGLVEGDIHSAFGDVLVEGGVGGDVNAEFGDVEVRAPVEGGVEAGFGDVYVRRGSLRLGPNARVFGHVFVSDGELRGRSGSVVGEGVVMGAGLHPSDSPGFPEPPGLTGHLFAALAFAACAVLAAVLAPGPLSAHAAQGRGFTREIFPLRAGLRAGLLRALRGARDLHNRDTAPAAARPGLPGARVLRGAGRRVLHRE